MKKSSYFTKLLFIGECKVLRISLLILIVLFAATPAFAQTQAEMTQQACNDYKAADKALNTAYQALRKTCLRDKAFLRRLLIAQQSWITWRDAETDALYPLGPASGTLQPQQRCMNMMDMTQKRTADLKAWRTQAKNTYLCEGGGL
jgi:uncharacterized protein YecT (DUF1311 family)